MGQQKFVILLSLSVAIVLGLVAGLVFAGARIFRATELEPRLVAHQTELEKRVRILEGLLPKAPQLPFLTVGPRKADAAEFFDSRVEWKGSFAAAHDCRRLSSFLTDPGRHIGVERTDWTAADLELVTDKFDFAWFYELRQYDHWDVSRSHTFSCAFQRLQDPAHLPEPHFSGLVRWAKLRLVHGVKKQDLGGALFETRALGSLLLTTETVAGLSAGLRIFELQSHLHRFLSSTRKVKRLPSSWKPESVEDMARMQDILGELGAVVHFLTPGSFLGEVFSDPKSLALVKCAALGSGLPRVVQARAELAEFHPSVFSTIDQILTGNREFCRLAHLRDLWASPVAVSAKQVPAVLRFLLLVPSIRRTWGEHLLLELPEYGPSLYRGGGA